MEELVPTILIENKRLEDEIKQLTKEIDELRKIQNELENKYLNLFCIKCLIFLLLEKEALHCHFQKMNNSFLFVRIL